MKLRPSECFQPASVKQAKSELRILSESSRQMSIENVKSVAISLENGDLTQHWPECMHDIAMNTCKAGIVGADPD